jgi:nucleoside-diphosphate-sugar epimerase
VNVLIVGGTGLTGATTARYLREKGHEVTLMARSKPANPALAEFPFRAANYIEDDIDPGQLAGFDWLVFAAGADIRMLPEGEDPATFFPRANARAIPAFFAAAKAAGIRRAAYLGTYYPQVVPEKIDTDVYVRSRHEADIAIRAMSDETFAVCSVNAPFIIGTFPGVVDAHLAALVQYVSGKIEGLPVVAPGGGVHHITALSLAEALEGALERGEPGRAYLVGDAYMAWQDYFQQFCAAVGQPRELEVSEEEHPMLPDMILYAGRNAVVDYEPDNAPLNYTTGRVPAAIVEVARAYG